MARVDHRRRGEKCAALLGAAIVLSGCSSASTPAEPGDTASTSRFTSLFSGSASPAAQAAAGGPAFNADDCPNVELRAGAGTFTVAGTAIGFRPIRDMTFRPLPDFAEQFAAQTLLARRPAGHHPARGAQDAHAQAAENPSNLLHPDVAPAAGP